MTLYTNVGGGKPCARVSETAKAQQPVASACLLKSHPVSMMCVRAFHTGHRVSAKPNKPKFYSTTRFFIFSSREKESRRMGRATKRIEMRMYYYVCLRYYAETIELYKYKLVSPVIFQSAREPIRRRKARKETLNNKTERKDSFQKEHAQRVLYYLGAAPPTGRKILLRNFPTLLYTQHRQLSRANISPIEIQMRQQPLRNRCPKLQILNCRLHRF